MTNRRELLKMLSATGAVGLGAGLSMLSLDSTSASSAAYKALVAPRYKRQHFPVSGG